MPSSKTRNGFTLAAALIVGGAIGLAGTSVASGALEVEESVE